MKSVMAKVNQIGQLSLAIACLACTGSAFAQSGGPVQAGDLAFGLSNGINSNTLQLVRGCTYQGNWNSQAFIQSVEFDNLGGHSHAANGNLLGLNFGTTGAGGSLSTFSTDGSDNGTTIFYFDGNSGTARTRVGGLSVSPDNTHLALTAYDTGDLIILDYTAGTGDGLTGSITAAQTYTNAVPVSHTQGTAWMDNSSVLVYAFDPNNSTSTNLIVMNSGTGTVENSMTIAVRDTTSGFTDVEYNPAISQYVYCMESSFSSGLSENTLTVVDPTDWSIVKQVTLDNSMDTGREIALSPDGKLYMSAYGGSANVGPFVSTISDDPNQMTDDGSIPCYQAVDISSSYNGIDVAVDAGSGGNDYTAGTSGTCPGTVTVTWSGAEPHKTHGLVFAHGTGNLVIPNGNPCAGTQLGLNGQGTMLVNPPGFISTGNGSGQISGNASQGACGGYVQWVTGGSCATSTVAQIP